MWLEACKGTNGVSLGCPLVKVQRLRVGQWIGIM